MKIFSGNVINPQGGTKVTYLPEGAICTFRGRILDVGDKKTLIERYPYAHLQDYEDSIMIPGLIDLHTHIPQFPAMGIGSGALLDWLKNYIYPMEKQFEEKSFADKYTRIFFRKVLEAGTTVIVAYSSLHRQAADIAFRVAEESGIKAFIGKTMMDREDDNDYYNSVEDNIEESLSLAEKWHKKDNGRLNYILSPRYAGSCTGDILKKSAEISKSEDLLLQTHLAENSMEVELIRNLFPENSNYTDVYREAGILNENSIFAHGIHLSDDELGMISDSGANIVHCPNSNRFLQSGVMPLVKMKGMDIPVGLGTDIAGGYSLSVLEEMKEAIEISKIKNMMTSGDENFPPISPEIALNMATIDAAKILKIDSTTGNFQQGKDADFVILENQLSDMPESLQNPEFLLRKAIYGKPKVLRTIVREKEIYSIF